MTNILVIGTGPLFGPDVTFFSGQAHRTWHFARTLAAHGHQVDLVVLQVEGDAHKDPAQPPLIASSHLGLPYHLVNAVDPTEILTALTQRYWEVAPQAIVAVNVNAAYLACQLPAWEPLWADLYGHLMGEAQAKCLRDNTDELLTHFWRRQRIILRRADKLSCVSTRQKYATLGELGAVGRLNRLTARYPFTCVIPAAASEEYLALPASGYVYVFRGRLFPENAFALLWSGGFNTWTDPSALAAALSLAMEQEPRIHLVVTGGTIRGHDERTFAEFQHEMQRAGFSDRCHYLGWIQGRQLLDLYRDCDLGLSLDALMYESLFGARTRLTNMMAAGLPILTTVCTEITEIIEEQQLGFTVPIGDINGYADAILYACRHPHETRRLGRKAREYARQHFSYEATAQLLLQWAEHPQLAPDNLEKRRLFPNAPSPRDVALNPLEDETRLLEFHDIQTLAHKAAELDALRSHPLYRAYLTLKNTLRKR